MNTVIPIADNYYLNHGRAIVEGEYLHFEILNLIHEKITLKKHNTETE